MNIVEPNKNKNNSIDVFVENVSDADAKINYNINYGGNYFISVSTKTPNAIPSPFINYRAPELPPPHQVKVFVEARDRYKVYWQKPTLPLNSL